MAETHTALPSSPAIRVLEPMARAILRCRDPHVAAASRLLGLDLPRDACRSRSSGETHALWLGPDEWLILSAVPPPVEPVAWAEIHASFVDVSHRQVAITLSGAKVELCLASGCPLDLAIAAFPVGACTRTLFHKAEIVLWRTAPDAFHIDVWRSFAPYVRALLAEAIDTQG